MPGEIHIIVFLSSINCWNHAMNINCIQYPLYPHLHFPQVFKFPMEQPQPEINNYHVWNDMLSRVVQQNLIPSCPSCLGYETSVFLSSHNMVPLTTHFTAFGYQITTRFLRLMFKQCIHHSLILSQDLGIQLIHHVEIPVSSEIS